MMEQLKAMIVSLGSLNNRDNNRTTVICCKQRMKTVTSNDSVKLDHFYFRDVGYSRL